MKHRRRVWFAAPLVAVTAGCSSSPKKSHETDFDRLEVDGTACVYYQHVHCPKGAMCNPPPPRAVECPAGMGASRGAAIGAGGSGCLLYPDPCTDRTCAVDTPCLRQGFDEIAPLAWKITPGSDGRCVATGVSRTGFDSHPAIPINCPPGGAIERANAKAPCVACNTLPCPMNAYPILCPDVKGP